MNSVLEVAKVASFDIEQYLSKNPFTVGVINVENNKLYQKEDIDLLWIYKNSKEDGIKRIEIKGDRYHKTGNIFIETISNMNKNTLGCFIYTKADYIFYYFVEIKKLYILPMPLTRDWFLNNTKRFPLKTLSTTIRGFDVYCSQGRTVPINTLIKEVEGIRIIDLGEKI